MNCSFFQKKSYSALAIILTLIIISVLLDFREPFNSPLKKISNTNSKSSPSIKNRKILILYTGGTIGMEETPKGYAPKKGYLEAQLKKILNLHSDHAKIISPHHIKEYNPLLDSSNMTPKDWNKMARDIEKHYQEYDAFIIIHGTDTLAYSASALSFIFKNLSKPVILTASMVPLARINNDGQSNLLESLIYASNYNIPEVVIIVADGIFRGNRTTKKSANKLDAFACPNFVNIGQFGYTHLPVINTSLVRKSHGIFSTSLYDDKNQVLLFFLTPGCNFKIIKDSIINNPNIKGVILLTYGIGDAPTTNKEFVSMLNFMKLHNIIVANITQCYEGRVDQSDYATGSLLKQHGVLSGQDLTIEAGYCKLLFLLGKYANNPHKIREEFKKDLRGEMSPSLKIKDVK